MTQQLDAGKDPQLEPTAPTHPNSFTPPPGYVLLPQAVYDMLVRQAEGTGQGGPRAATDKIIHLRVLRPVQLGDIKTQLNPEEEIEWVPRKSVTVRGKENHILGSFLCYWNRQDPRSFKYDPHFSPVFDIINPETLDEVLGPAPQKRNVRRPIDEETARIRREEGKGDATARHTSEPVQGLKMTHGPVASSDLPPPGSPERKALIHGQSIERQNVAQRRTAGLGNEEPESVEDFKVTTGRQDQRVIGMIDGPSAEAEPITEKEVAADARRRKTRR